MYDYVPAAEAAALAAAAPGGVMANDRARFEPFLAEAEAYAHARGLIVSGASAVQITLQISTTPFDYTCEFYSRHDAMYEAKTLAEHMYALDPEGLGRYAMMATLVPHQTFEVYVDERPLVRVLSLPHIRGIRLADLASPVGRPARFAKDSAGRPLMLKCMSPEILLAATCAKLSDPSCARQWPTLLREEERLRAMYLAEVASGRAPKHVKPAKFKGAGEPRPPGRELEFRAALLRDFVPGPGRVLAGGEALARLGGRVAASPLPRLHVVTANDLVEEAAAVGRIAAEVKVRVRAEEREVNLPGDPELRSLTIYAELGSASVVVMDIFSAGAYQLVSCALSADGVAIASPYALMRFILVEVWRVTLTVTLRGGAMPRAREIISSLVELYGSAAAVLENLQAAGDYAAIFPREAVGVYVDPVIAAKRARHIRPANAPGVEVKQKTFYPPLYVLADINKPRDGRKGKDPS